MKNIVNTIVILVISLFISSCRLFGPPFPEKQAREFLEGKNVSSTLINKVTNKKQLTLEEFKRFSKSTNESVRFLIASNQYIPKDLQKKMAHDKSSFVRAGVATNIAIEKRIIDLLKTDNISVQSALVSNPSVSSNIILDLYKQNRKINLINFALNPYCPEEIKKDIRHSVDGMAQDCLKNVERWKKEGKYDSQGAWIGE